MFESLRKGQVEVLVASLTQSPGRALGADVLPTIGLHVDELFIKTMKEDAFVWTSYIHTFSKELWLTIGFFALVISLALSYLQFRAKKVDFCKSELKRSTNILIGLGNLWMAVKANFGGKPVHSGKY